MVGPATHDDKLRERLLNVTIERVDQQGLAAVSLRSVAASAETSTSAVYSLFGNKDALLQAVVEQGFESLARSQEKAAGHGLAALAHAHRSWALAHPAKYRLMLNGVLDDLQLSSDSVQDAADRALAPLMAELGRVRPELDEDAITIEALAIWAQLHGVVSLQLGGVVGTEQLWQELHDDLVDRLDRAWQPPASPS